MFLIYLSYSGTKKCRVTRVTSDEFMSSQYSQPAAIGLGSFSRLVFCLFSNTRTWLCDAGLVYGFFLWCRACLWFFSWIVLYNKKWLDLQLFLKRFSSCSVLVPYSFLDFTPVSLGLSSQLFHCLSSCHLWLDLQSRRNCPPFTYGMTPCSYF